MESHKKAVTDLSQKYNEEKEAREYAEVQITIVFSSELILL